MKKLTFLSLLVLSFFSFQSFTVYGADPINMEVGAIQSGVPVGTPHPSGGRPQKGYVGSLLSKLFNGDNKIQFPYLDINWLELGFVVRGGLGLDSMGNNSIPKWNATTNQFENSNIFSSGGSIGIGKQPGSGNNLLTVSGAIVSEGGAPYDSDLGAVIISDDDAGYAGIIGYPGTMNGLIIDPIPWDGDWNDANNFFFTGNSGAKLGIGVSDPSYNLDVSGDINFTGNLYNDGTLFEGGKFQNGADPRDAVYVTSGGVTRRNVGIGTSTPTQRLEVNGNIKVEGIGLLGGRVESRYVDNTHYGYFDVRRQDGTRGAYFGYGNGGDIVNLYLQNANKLGITGGSVGIGTSNPSQKLELVGNMRISGSAPTLQLRDVDHDNFILHANSDRLYFMHDTNNNFNYDDGPDDRVVMYSPGNGVRLGIGTNTPSQALDVNGNIRATNQMRASRYCDLSGTRCLPGDIGGAFYHVTSNTGIASCNGTDIRIACSGSREENVDDTCDENDCGFVGVIPYGARSCKTGIDFAGGTEAVATVYCMHR